MNDEDPFSHAPRLAPPAPHAPPSARPVRYEFTCIACGYALRGQRIEDLCPECGTPIAVSLRNIPTSGSAIAALVLGIISILGCAGYGIPSLITGPLAIYFSYRAKAQVREGRAGQNSVALAKAGFICAIVGLSLGALSLLFLLIFFLIPLLLTP